MEETFSVKPVPPFRLDLTVWTLRRRPDNAVDRWDGQSYERILDLDGHRVKLEVTQTAPPEAPRLEIKLVGPRTASNLKPAVVASVERLLGIRIDLTDFYRLAARDAKLGPLVDRFRGMKPPRFSNIFEALTNGIACQQVTLTQGIRVLNRLAQEYGPSFEGTNGFPSPEVIAEQKPEALRQLGLSHQKADYLIGLGRAVVEGRIDLEGLGELDNAAVVKRLTELRGVGRWTAEYALLRGFGRLDVFPGDDVGAWNNLRRWLHLRKPQDYDSVRRIVSRWQPYAGLIYFHLLLDRLDEAGYLPMEDKREESYSRG